MKKNKFLIILTLLLFIPLFSQAADRSIVTDWYIHNFESEIIVNNDSSLTITENITADCGNLSGKHGIFRVLPTQINTTDRGTIKTPVKLISITDFNGKRHEYSTINDRNNHTITWKIGDADKTVTGVNYYLIKYRVENAVRTENPDFDELYWNLNGNFWDIETDNFTATIIFPSGIDKNNADVSYYTGYLGYNDQELAEFSWIDNNTLKFTSKKTLLEKQGITASIIFPKNIITPYEPPFLEKYGWLIIFILPPIALIICFLIWKRYGDDPSIKKTIIPEFEIPENLTPMELGALKSNGRIDPEFITATIINLAVNKIIIIEETKKEGVLSILGGKKIKFHLKNKEAALTDSDKKVLQLLFGEDLSSDKVNLSAVKKKMQDDINFSSDLQKLVQKELQDKGLITKSGLTAKKIMLPIGIMLTGTLIPFLIWGLPYLAIALAASGLIVFIFSFFMPKRTAKGMELNWKIKGFKLYMETAEKYRQQFFEKENMFEKLLPYAMVFGMTKVWIKKMEEIYGKDYFASYHPVWFIGASTAAFDAKSFTSQISSISSSINSVATASSGRSGGGGGGGFSGGGGGGGGGGGW
jgi:uncharacterized membrane protein